MQVQMCSFLKVKKAKRGGVLSSTGTVVQYKDRTEWSRMKNGNRTDRARRFVGVGYGSTADFRSRRTQGQSGLAPSNFFFPPIRSRRIYYAKVTVKHAACRINIC